ncbi:hypothetical protein IWQ61_005338 [Dispira simplex]|nr:hypothetical protein IWQ61_005338 [Dispira simplex]
MSPSLLVPLRRVPVTGPVLRLPYFHSTYPLNLHSPAHKGDTISLDRRYTTSTPPKGVTLAYSMSTPAEPSSASYRRPVVILHGLLGSKQNWNSLSKALAQHIQTEVYSLDLRNHGDSPQVEPMTYAAMSQDVVAFCNAHRLQQPLVVGHSMGGKVAMTLALEHPKVLGLLCVVDIAPLRIPLSGSFKTYLHGMQEVEKWQFTKKADADRLLQPYVPDITVRQFLLTNYKRNPGDSHYYFRVPLDTLLRSLPELGAFPADESANPFTKPTLFIFGSRSDYVLPGYHETIRQRFPQTTFQSLDAGHWVHAEQPHEFVKLVSQFYRQHTDGSAGPTKD